MSDSSPATPAATSSTPLLAGDKVPAGFLPPWDVGELPYPPAPGWRLWIGLIGPGVVLAGTSIGSGEWLFGPAVSAQYGATLLWLALISIVFQVFANLILMRYTVYCGEPIVVGGMRVWPGPRFWIGLYATLDLAALWPYNAANAAVPLAAAILGHLPESSDAGFVKKLGCGIFLLAFVPLIFGGTVYRMLEKIMTFKLVVVLGYLTFVAVFMVSGAVVWEVCSGFVSFGTVPIRADTVVAGRHFTVVGDEGGTRFVVKGTFEEQGPLIAAFLVSRNGETKEYKRTDPIRDEWKAKRAELVAAAKPFALPNDFWVESRIGEIVLTARGHIAADRSWQLQRAIVRDGGGSREYEHVADIPAPHAARVRAWLTNQGLEKVGIVGYLREHGHMPPLDWAMIAGLCAIAGAGGMSNTMFSNYARDKGWGMGKHVGAIPSAVGGLTIALSHTGRVFDHHNPKQLSRWRGWIHHITRDQVAIWFTASVLGMALPCMLSLEFIRNAPVVGDRVAAMVAEGMAVRYPGFRWILWTLTLLCGFLILAPGQVSVGDQIARRWTDVIWSTTAWAKRLNRVGRVYYGILSLYAVLGFFLLASFETLTILKYGAVLSNVALGCVTLHALYVNRTLLPPPLRPNLFLQIGAVGCAIFFFGITAVVVATMKW